MNVYYYDVRDKMMTGDVILWKGTSLFARAIGFWSEYTHVSSVFRLREYSRERVLVNEMLSGGAELRWLSVRIQKFHGRVFWYHIHATERQRLLMGQFALDTLGNSVKYDYGGLLANALGRVSQDARLFFCSEMSQAEWKAGRYALLRDKDGNPRTKAPRPGDMIPWDNHRGELVEITMEEAA